MRIGFVGKGTPKEALEYLESGVCAGFSCGNLGVILMALFKINKN